jgi:glycosidase
MTNRSLCSPLVLCVALLVACGTGPSGPNVPPDDEPPRPGGGTYGSGGSGGSGGGNEPPMCADFQKRCPYEFVYEGTGMEKSVELRGDHRMGGWDMGEPLTLSGKTWRLTTKVPWQEKFRYKFRVVNADNSERWIADPKNPQGEPDGFGGTNSILSGVTCAKWTCDDTIKPPGCAPTGSYDWRDAVMYFVFVDRFLNGSMANDRKLSLGGLPDMANWLGGDWAGVVQKIKDGYFQSLGVNTLWLTVPMENGDSVGLGTDGKLYSGYHGYWPLDLDKTEGRFGSKADFKALVNEAHSKGLKVVIDYAMHHMHKDAPIYRANPGWFHSLRQGAQDCICGEGMCGWDHDVYGLRCWFRDYLPTFDFTNAAARKYSVDNVLSWMLDNQLDGLRLDAIKHVDMSWLTDLRARLTSDVEKKTGLHPYLVGETYSGNRGLILKYVDPATKLDGQFDFPLRAELDSKVLMRQGKMQDLEGFMNSNTSFYGCGIMSTFIGNHDVPRSVHFAEDVPLWGDVWADGKNRNWTNQPGKVAADSAYERMAVAMAILMTNRGVPLIYYGDEIGLAGAGDPDNRRFMEWSGYNGGQLKLLDRMKKLGAQRAAHSALRRGNRTTLSITDDTWAYQMKDGSDSVIVIVNRSDSARTVSGIPAGMYRDQIANEMVAGPNVSVPARGVRLLTQ